jgi:hypothetical protein
MGFKSRGYDRTDKEFVRDYKLFAIACEGSVREPAYFKVFEHLSTKIKVDVIQSYDLDGNISTKSSPKWLLDKAMGYVEENGLLEEDELWFVLDVDRWEREQIQELADYCKGYSNWNIAISNPCFEVWLLFHKKSELDFPNDITPKELKQKLAEIETGGYHKLHYIKLIEEAIGNAERADVNSTHFLPIPNTTKVYRLAQALKKNCTVSEFDIFITETIPSLIKKYSHKLSS